MTKKELVQKLERFPDDVQVMIKDSFNGAGIPREINSGPREHKITKEDAEESADCEEIVGQKVVVIGFGSY
jgi:hypothetical protein